ncbi:hypothetical protein NQ314_012134 [Rhamnusium bicolor]|uniref:Uncharacterized protein n=1 Tax=Rhamnusium bicolor TaxID=1586634 RepID=A0AAV8XCX1_9CUCU|nr:hypothetical protein NQ314_012134 [Rhamnusium bicolor]
MRDYVEQCLLQIDNMIRESTVVEYDLQNETACENEIRPGEFTPPPAKNQEHEAALTPTDVHDVHF